MSDQQSRQDDEPEPQQHDGQVVLPPRVLPPRVVTILRVIGILADLMYLVMLDRFARRPLPTPYHTSALSGESWVHELLTGHPRRIRTELGVHRSTFILLVKSMQKLGLRSSRHVSIEEQLAIFLYTVVTGLSCVHVGERFQHSTSTITK
jgi:hypothetical protein